MSSAWAMIDNVWRLGTLRPLSTKLICFCDTPVSSDRSNWLLPRTSRQWRNSAPSSLAGAFRFDEFMTAEHPQSRSSKATGIQGRVVAAFTPLRQRRMIWREPNHAPSSRSGSRPGLGPEALIDWRTRHVRRGGGERGNADGRDHLENLNFRISGRRKLLDIRLGHISPLFDKGFGQRRKSRIFRILRQFSVTDGLYLAFSEAVLDGKGGMNRDGQRALDGHCVREQDDLPLNLVEASTMETTEAAGESVEKNRAVRHGRNDVRQESKALFQRLQR